MPLPEHPPRSLDRGISLTLRGLACLFLGMAASKPLILALGARATGVIVRQEGGVSSRGAYGVRYRFTAGDGRVQEGTAFTSVKDARFVRVPIAYLPACPWANLPASVGYALITGLGWTLAGLLTLVVARVLHPRRRMTGATS